MPVAAALNPQHSLGEINACDTTIAAAWTSQRCVPHVPRILEFPKITRRCSAVLPFKLVQFGPIAPNRSFPDKRYPSKSPHPEMQFLLRKKKTAHWIPNQRI